MMAAFSFEIANAELEFEQGKLLFKEYAATLDFDLGYQGFDSELATIATQYKAPSGALLVCYDQQKTAVGCAGIRKFSEDVAELKRLYVQPAFRGFKLGRKLLELSIQTAADLHYNFIRLDTVPSQRKAQDLYRYLGFYEIESYRYSPIDGTMFFEKKLRGA
ncbi:MAG TPA: GNAT family N-acetyltransferase [Arachidicoccus sp.]|nr:GNAT family N-acetyltransferase [Arachidicoccus sp.]